MDVKLERRAGYEVEALLMITGYEVEASIERRVSCWYSMRAFLEKTMNTG